MAKGISNKAKEVAKSDADPILERMNDALKKMMETPHETQKEMIERRRQGKKGVGPASQQRLKKTR